MKKFHAILLLMGAAALMACSDDNGGDEGKDIQLAPGTPKDYTIFADETSGTPSEGISFTTAGPWRATVAETPRRRIRRLVVGDRLPGSRRCGRRLHDYDHARSEYDG